ncbi:MAG: hypothetical protein Q4P65_02995, partial [Eubacteriales bacterium]|nr:hypothetical protein [Eubacteriales bacterium]
TPATTKTVVYRFIFENTGNTELSKFVLNDEKLGIVNKTVLENVILQPGDRAIHEETVEIPVSGDNLGENFINTASGFATSSTGQEVFSEGSWTIAYGDKDIPVPEGEELSSYTFQKSSREKTAKVGEKVHFLFTYENTGTVTIQNLTLTDVFLGIEDQIIFAELKPGERMTYMVEHTVSEDDVKKPETGADGKPKIYNIATSNGKVPEDPNDPNNPPPLTPPPPSEHEIPLDDPDDGTTIEDPVAKLEFEKTAKCDTLKIQTPTPTITKDDIGKSIIYRFIYTNSGNVELFNLELLDPKLKLHVIAFESILPGEVRIYEYPYQITEADLKQDQLSNIASADADLPEGTKIPDSGNDIPVIPIPDPDPVPEDPVDVPEEPTPTIPQEEDTGIGEEFPYWLDHGHGYDYSVVMPKAKTETASKTSDPKWSSVAVPITGENREITVGISLMALLAAACLMMLRKRH